MLSQERDVSAQTMISCFVQSELTHISHHSPRASCLYSEPYGSLLTSSTTVYNKWHETELERWLSDNNVPYPSPADRKDLEDLVKTNWESKVSTPYKEWDTPQLQSYLKAKGVETKETAADNKDSLISSVQKYWYDTENKADEAWGSVKDWIFDRYVPFWEFETSDA